MSKKARKFKYSELGVPAFTDYTKFDTSIRRLYKRHQHLFAYEAEASHRKLNGLTEAMHECVDQRHAYRAAGFFEKFSKAKLVREVRRKLVDAIKENSEKYMRFSVEDIYSKIDEKYAGEINYTGSVSEVQALNAVSHSVNYKKASKVLNRIMPLFNGGNTSNLACSLDRRIGSVLFPDVVRMLRLEAHIGHGEVNNRVAELMLLREKLTHLESKGCKYVTKKYLGNEIREIKKELSSKLMGIKSLVKKEDAYFSQASDYILEQFKLGYTELRQQSYDEKLDGIQKEKNKLPSTIYGLVWDRKKVKMPTSVDLLINVSLRNAIAEISKIEKRDYAINILQSELSESGNLVHTNRFSKELDARIKAIVYKCECLRDVNSTSSNTNAFVKRLVGAENISKWKRHMRHEIRNDLRALRSAMRGKITTNNSCNASTVHEASAYEDIMQKILARHGRSGKVDLAIEESQAVLGIIKNPNDFKGKSAESQEHVARIMQFGLLSSKLDSKVISAEKQSELAEEFKSDLGF